MAKADVTGGYGRRQAERGGKGRHPFEKQLANVVKHGVDFTDACRLFEGPFMIMTDNRRDYGEIRSIAFGDAESCLIAAAFTKRQDLIRIIAARKANDSEKRDLKTQSLTDWK